MKFGVEHVEETVSETPEEEEDRDQADREESLSESQGRR